MPCLALIRFALLWFAALLALEIGSHSDLSRNVCAAADRTSDGAQAGRGTLTFVVPGQRADRGQVGSEVSEAPQPSVRVAWPSGADAAIKDHSSPDTLFGILPGDETDAGAGDASEAEAREMAQLGELLAPRGLIRSRHSPHASTKEKVRRVLDYYTRKGVNSADNNCWEVMHWIIAYGVNAKLQRGAAGGPPVNAIGWLSFGNRCAGQPLVYADQGRLIDHRDYSRGNCSPWARNRRRQRALFCGKRDDCSFVVAGAHAARLEDCALGDPVE